MVLTSNPELNRQAREVVPYIRKRYGMPLLVVCTGRWERSALLDYAHYAEQLDTRVIFDGERVVAKAFQTRRAITAFVFDSNGRLTSTAHATQPV
jgi:hypothetical protein